MLQLSYRIEGKPKPSVEPAKPTDIDLDGIPNETRQPFEDGSTDFERILPGPDRMYPDTDSPPSRVTRERVDRRGNRIERGKHGRSSSCRR